MRGTVGEVAESVGPGLLAKACPRWPPDAFAIAATILRRSNSYPHVIRQWPPRKNWIPFITEVGRQWRRSVVGHRQLPKEPGRWWRAVQTEAQRPIDKLTAVPKLVEALLQLVAAADVASACAGVPVGRFNDAFDYRAHELLDGRRSAASLCDKIDPSRVSVLPKLHTPQSGINVRSLTHHLALFDSGEVSAEWTWVLPKERWSHGVNTLLVPWPYLVRPAAFQPAIGRLDNLDTEKFGFFTSAYPEERLSISRLQRLVAAAQREVGPVKILMFPELALRKGEAEKISNRLGMIVIGGESTGPAGGREPGRNYAATAIPFSRHRLPVVFRQPKHHRWKLDRSQIHQYGLGSLLNPSRQWWEHIEVKRRQLSFFSFDQWLTFTALICEDLAQQEPVADLVRSVGPHLVVALLMDGPQLIHRWPARYATVLADDPGSSVLTLTSLGMSLLSRAPGRASSRVIAMWKERGSAAMEIELPSGYEGVVLSLTKEPVQEWSADGRENKEGAWYLRLSGVHPVKSSS